MKHRHIEQAAERLSTTPLVSVIIPVWNNARQLKTCLDALQQQSLPADQFEILVVDNGSSDESVAVARTFDRVTVLEEKRPGSYAARNRALAVARGQFLAFTDSDCVPDRDWLSSALSMAEEHANLGVVAGPIILFAEAPNEAPTCTLYESMFAFPQDAAKGDCATANWLSPRHVFDQVGGFDDHIKSGADKLMALKIRQRGYALEYAPGMTIRHPTRSTLAGLVNKKRRLAGGQWDKARTNFKLLYLLAVDGKDVLGKCRKVFFRRDLPASNKVKLAGLVALLGAISATEHLRLAFGGGSSR